jgi:hypothetical protein
VVKPEPFVEGMHGPSISFNFGMDVIGVACTSVTVVEVVVNRCKVTIMVESSVTITGRASFVVKCLSLTFSSSFLSYSWKALDKTSLKKLQTFSVQASGSSSDLKTDLIVTIHTSIVKVRLQA